MNLSRVIIGVAGILCGCSSAPQYQIKEPDYGNSEYANFHKSICRSDIEQVCVEANVALDQMGILELLDRAGPRVGHDQIVAIRVEPHRSRVERLPVLSVVSGSYSWLSDGSPVEWNTEGKLSNWGGSEVVVLYKLTSGGWEYIEVLNVIYDPV